MICLGRQIVPNHYTCFILPNAIWVVSENRATALAAFREPPPQSQAQPSNSSPFCGHVSMANSGYRTRYPLVAATTTGRLG